jgi:hypothetical protein
MFYSMKMFPVRYIPRILVALYTFLKLPMVCSSLYIRTKPRRVDGPSNKTVLHTRGSGRLSRDHGA